MILISESSRFSRVSIATVLLVVLGSAVNAWAGVTIDAKVTDSEAGRVFSNTSSPAGAVVTNSPVVNPTSREVKLTSNPPMSVSVTASGPSSYGYGAASDTIVNNFASKSVAPTIVLKPGYTVSKTTAYADPVGAVTLQVQPSSGSPNQMVNMQFFLPTPSSIDVDHSIDDSVGRSQLVAGALPTQGIYFDSGGLTDAQLNGALDVTYSLHAHVTQAGVIDTDLFNGTIVFHNNSNPSVSLGGGFANGIFFTEDSTLGAGHFIALNGSDLSAVGFQVQANTDFDLEIEASMSVGDESGPDFTAGGAPNFMRPTGVLGLFTAGASPVDRANFSLSVVPEPSTLVLAALAGLSLTAYGWRKQRSR